MMPIFFHAESHLWIAYLLFVNGALITLILRARFATVRALLSNFESLTLSAFFISLAANGLVLLALQTLQRSFQSAVMVLATISLATLLVLWRSGAHKHAFSGLNWNWSRALFYGLVFCILFINGGLIEQVTDAWWHMSLANKIGIESTFSPSVGHLTGLPTRYYPPLWHGNLALIHLASGEMLPVIWNSFTAWGSVLKVMAFFLMARALTGSKRIGFLSAVLFVLVPGVGNSYLRVSAWPSHIAYTAWFAMFALTFSWLNRLPEAAKPGEKNRWQHIKAAFDYEGFMRLAAGMFLAALIYFLHKAELLYFALGVFFYVIALLMQSAWSSNPNSNLEPGKPFLLAYGVMFGGFVVYLAIRLLLSDWATSDLDTKISYGFPIVALLFVGSVFLLRNRCPRTLVRGSIVFFVIAFVLMIDTQHLFSLFNAELAHPRGVTHQAALVAPGYFGGELKAPGWHLQLRQGLLYSGVLSIPCSVALAFYRPSRSTLFLAANGVLVFLILSSPYLYNWLYGLLDYHSPWRIAILIWHPIVIALTAAHLYRAWESRA